MPIMARVRRFLPFLSWTGELRQPGILRADIIAGITVALVLVPQSMAYAQLAGLSPLQGLYASFLPVLVGALFGSSRQLATGPVAVVSLLTAAALAPIAATNPEGVVIYAALLAVVVGVLQLALGMLRLGVLVDFLSHPVVSGFTNAAAIIIATSQLDKLFGVSIEKGAHHYETVWNTMTAALQNTHWLTLAMGTSALTIMLVLRRVAPKVPAVLTAVAVTTVASYVIHFEQLGGKVVGVIPTGLPAFAMPQMDWAMVFGMVQSAITITLIGFMEAISIAKAMATLKRQRLDANQELIGQGLANLTSSAFQGYPVSGSFSRSAVNLNAGAETGFSSVVTGAIVGATLLWLTPLLYHLPQATLAAVIMMAVFTLINISPLTHAWRVQPQDAVVGMIVLALTLFTAPHLETGIMLGIALSLGLYVFRTMRPRMVVLSRHTDGTLRDATVHILKTCSKITILRFDGSLFFANAGYFENKVLEVVAANSELKYIVIDAESMNEIDSSGEEMLHHLASRLYASGMEMLFARVKKQVMDPFIRAGFVKQMGEDHFFRTRTLALEYAWKRLDEDHKLSCPLNKTPVAAAV
jgi:sulfate permease, SulP family